MPAFDPTLFLLGCIGGLLPDLLRIYRNKNEPDLPAYLKTGGFWLRLAISVVLGGLVVWVLDIRAARDALATGYGAPQLISQIVGGATAAKPDPQLGGGVKAERIRNWWAM